MRSLAKLNQDARLLVAAHSGHMVPWDNPDRCLEVIGELLGEITDGEKKADAPG